MSAIRRPGTRSWRGRAARQSRPSGAAPSATATAAAGDSRGRSHPPGPAPRPRPGPCLLPRSGCASCATGPGASPRPGRCRRRRVWRAPRRDRDLRHGSPLARREARAPSIARRRHRVGAEPSAARRQIRRQPGTQGPRPAAGAGCGPAVAPAACVPPRRTADAPARPPPCRRSRSAREFRPRAACPATSKLRSPQARAAPRARAVRHRDGGRRSSRPSADRSDRRVTDWRSGGLRVARTQVTKRARLPRPRREPARVRTGRSLG